MARIRLRWPWILAAVLLFSGTAIAVGTYKAAITFGRAASWTAATGGYPAVEGMLNENGNPTWHYDGGTEVAMALPVQTGQSGKFLTTDGNAASWATVSGGGGGGSVTSVAMTVPGSFLSVAGSPITSAGTLAVTALSQSAHTVFAGPVSSSAAPTFRLLGDSDMPAHTPTCTPSNVNDICSWTGSAWAAQGGHMSVRRTITQPADGTSFTITLPTTASSSSYKITATLADATAYVIVACPTVSRTTVNFVCTTSGALSTGDSIDFEIDL